MIDLLEDPIGDIDNEDIGQILNVMLNDAKPEHSVQEIFNELQDDANAIKDILGRIPDSADK